MIQALALLLGFQLAGEVIARGAALPVPGPVIGLVLLVIALALIPRLVALLEPLAKVLLSHLSLLFVPAGVGIMGHLDLLRAEGVALAVTLLASTVLAIAVGALVFARLGRTSAPQAED